MSKSAKPYAKLKAPNATLETVQFLQLSKQQLTPREQAAIAKEQAIQEARNMATFMLTVDECDSCNKAQAKHETNQNFSRVCPGHELQLDLLIVSGDMRPSMSYDHKYGPNWRVNFPEAADAYKDLDKSWAAREFKI